MNDDRERDLYTVPNKLPRWNPWTEARKVLAEIAKPKPRPKKEPELDESEPF